MIKQVGVIGAGIMGHGIAELCAINGFHVLINDVNDELLGKALEKIRWSLERLAKRNEIQEEPDMVMGRISVTTDLSQYKDIDLVIEAVKEKTEIKRQVLSKVDSIVKKECIISTNTSTIPISELASMTKREDRFIGLHFSNPPVIMPIVEIINGARTSNKTLESTRKFVISLKKESVVVRKDVPGFLINRLNDRVISESMIMLEEGTSRETLDSMVRFRLGFPMGICELLDFVGIDTVYNANKEMVRRGFNSSSSDILRQKVEDGQLGAKTGEGFYTYPKLGEYVRPFVVPRDDMYAINPLRILAVAINEAAWLLRNEVCSEEDIEKAMKLAMNWPHGPLEYADRNGLDEVVKQLRQRWAQTSESRYSPDPLLLEKLQKNELGWKTGRGFMGWNHSEENFGPVKYTRMHDYALIEMNRPEKLNSLNEDAWRGLKDAFDFARKDEGVRSVVITGKGRAFCAGDDIDMMDGWKGATDAKEWMQKLAEPLLDVITNYSKPIISAVNGMAFGGGCELNLFFDIIIASDRAVFSLPEGLRGAMPPLGTSYGYALVSRKLSRYALTGEWFSAEEARNMGLVDIVVPHEQLQVAVAEFAEKLARLAPLSSQAVKSTVNITRQVFGSQAKYGSDELVLLSSSKDFKEAQDAFLHRRPPIWEGR